MRDYSMFLKETCSKKCIILVYVDDLLLTGDDEEEMGRIKGALNEQFTIKDLGELTYFLGIEVSRKKEGILLNQRKFVLDILKSTHLEHCKAVAVPFPKGQKLSTEGGTALADPESYRRLIGKLLYLNLTRADISYAVQQLSQFMQVPRESHMQAALNVVKYLKGTIDWGLFYPSQGEPEVKCYCDADWGACSFSGRSLTGYALFLGDSLISWKTKKQKTVSKSSAEAEYRGMSQTAAEVVWIYGILEDMGMKIPKPVTMFCDNKAAQHIAANPVFHERTKHLNLDCHYVRERIQEGLISTQFVKSSEQLADLMTKGLCGPQHHFLSFKLGLVTHPKLQLEGGM